VGLSFSNNTAKKIVKIKKNKNYEAKSIALS
jgi:hypothetical protein